MYSDFRMQLRNRTNGGVLTSKTSDLVIYYFGRCCKIFPSLIDMSPSGPYLLIRSTLSLWTRLCKRVIEMDDSERDGTGSESEKRTFRQAYEQGSGEP